MMIRKQAGDFNGILLYTKPYKDKDLLAKFLIHGVGKKMFLVRGARRPNFKLRAAMLPFSYGKYIGTISDEGLSYVNDSKEINHFKEIVADINLNAYATYIMTLLDLAFEDGVIIDDWFVKLMTGMKLIDNGIDVQIITNIFELQLLNDFGVAPNFSNCGVCHRSDLPLDYSEAYGGLICQNHFHLDPYRLQLDAKTVYYLQLLSRVNLEQINSVKVAKATKLKLRQVIDQIYTNAVGFVPKSKRFIDQLNSYEL